MLSTPRPSRARLGTGVVGMAGGARSAAGDTVQGGVKGGASVPLAYSRAFARDDAACRVDMEVNIDHLEYLDSFD